MPYEIKKAWANLKCYRCNDMIPEHTLYLETSNMGGCYYYCPKQSCSGSKGYNPSSQELRRFDTLPYQQFNIDLKTNNNYKSYETKRAENEALTNIVWAMR